MKTPTPWMFCSLLLLIALASQPDAQADPCGMVPPYRLKTDQNLHIVRVGHQRTYVFFHKGMESFVIKPGFSGNVGQFGMLIPFPSPPFIRKMPDNIFDQLVHAIDPPEVILDMRGPGGGNAMAAMMGSMGGSSRRNGLSVRRERVRVIREEAVGMYTVAVLEASSAAALKRWMDKHKYRFPNGMEAVAEDYIRQEWCFVAVKARVAGKSAVAPRPGQRVIDNRLPDGAVFKGHVQALAFRFPSRRLVLPMRLSVFNGGGTRNIIYVLADKPLRVQDAPESFVVRQLPGAKLYDNLTGSLPIRVLGGSLNRLSQTRLQGLKPRLDPRPHNGAAAELIASDLEASGRGNLALAHEQTKRHLRKIDQFFGLREEDMTALHRATTGRNRRGLDESLVALKRMTLTVIDGVFARTLLADQNLTFRKYRMPAEKNRRSVYDARRFGPALPDPGGRLYSRVAPPPAPTASPEEAEPQVELARHEAVSIPLRQPGRHLPAIAWALAFAVSLALIWRSSTGRKRRFLFFLFLFLIASPLMAEDSKTPRTLGNMFLDLRNVEKAAAASNEIAAYAAQNQRQRMRAVDLLMKFATDPLNAIERRGWAIVTVSQIGGRDIARSLQDLQNDVQQNMLVRTWAAAARVKMARSMKDLPAFTQTVDQFPAVARSISRRMVLDVIERRGQLDVHQWMAEIITRTPWLARRPRLASAFQTRITELLAGDPKWSSDALRDFIKRHAVYIQPYPEFSKNLFSQLVLKLRAEKVSFDELMRIADTDPKLAEGILPLVRQSAEKSHDSLASLLRLGGRSSYLRRVVAPLIVKRDSKQAARLMLSGPSPALRREAAALLGRMHRERNDAKVIALVLTGMKFRPEASLPPWADGPLFLPGIEWGKKEARELAGHLIAWYVWCDARDQTSETRKVYISLSILAPRVGYRTPAHRRGALGWLQAWEAVVGRESVRQLLKQQDLLNKPKYVNAFPAR